ncbi:WAP four-disulfide core domain 3 [Perkinsus olseni]|uniref:WAP four-disulfide core domain 3 n=1 Tax=Perkinsus olseni TaxID=32597 RepID=A0A7J6T9A5_PEROL|nr:WAP four-disulfide core domain 3 [Perkinsus olseni]
MRIALLLPLLFKTITAADDIGSEPLVCPPVLSGTAGICVEMCSEEQPCGGEEMCCPNGCGHLCMAGVTEEEAEQIRQAQDNPSGASRAVSLLVGVVSAVVGMRMVSSVALAQPGELCCSNGCGKVCKVGVTQAEYDKLADFDKRSITGFSLMIGFDDNADLDEIAAALNSEKLGKILPASTESPNVSILYALKMAIVKVNTSEREDADALEGFVKGIPAVSAATKSMDIEWNYAKDSAVVGRGLACCVEVVKLVGTRPAKSGANPNVKRYAVMGDDGKVYLLPFSPLYEVQYLVDDT